MTTYHVTHGLPLTATLLHGRSINDQRVVEGHDAPLAERATVWPVTRDETGRVEYARVRLVGRWDRVLVDDLRAYVDGPPVRYTLDGCARGLIATSSDRDRIEAVVRAMLAD